MADNDAVRRVVDARGEAWETYELGWKVPSVYVEGLRLFSGGSEVAGAYADGIDALCDALAAKEQEVARLAEQLRLAHIDATNEANEDARLREALQGLIDYEEGKPLGRTKPHPLDAAFAALDAARAGGER